MVYDFGGFKVATKMLLYDQAMLKNISGRILAAPNGVWMTFRRNDKNVTVFADFAPSTPSRVSISHFAVHGVVCSTQAAAVHGILFARNIATVCRILFGQIAGRHAATNGAILGGTVSICLKRFFAVLTFDCYPAFLSVFKAAFPTTEPATFGGARLERKFITADFTNDGYFLAWHWHGALL